MLNKSAFRSILAAGVALSVLPSTAWAQGPATGEGADEGIVVTGQRQQYRGDVPIKEIPQSIQTIDAETLKNLNVTRLDDALSLASGVAKQNNFGGLWDAFAIRGFAGDENFPSGFLVNGFNGGRGYGGPRDASNIERIEVLKGPNAAVFGRGEPGGTVNIITKKANLDGNFGSFTLSGGSFNNYRVEGDYNLVISDKLAVRVNGAAQDSDSFRDYVHTTKYVASPSVLLKLSDQTSISYEMEFVDLKVPFERGVVAVDGVLGLIPRSRFLDEPGNGPTHVNVLGHQVQFQQDLGGNGWTFLAGFGYRDTSFKGYSDDPELAGSRQILDNDGIHLARQRRYRDFSTTNTVLRAEISGRIETGPFTHHVVLGGDWDRFNIDLYQTRYRPPAYTAGSTITAANNAIDIYDPVYGYLPEPNTTITNSLEKQKSYGIYAQDQIDITDKLKVRFGGRFDHFHQLIGNREGAFAPTIDVLKKRFSPSAGVLYEITGALSIYGGYGTGFRPNSGQAAPDADGYRAPFAPETSKSYEVGLRYSSPMVNATLAAFTMKKNNILTSDPVNAGYSMAAGAARSKGIELDVNAKLPGDINVMASYAYTDAYWSSSSLDPNFAVQITPGDPLINIPKHQANVIVSKDFDLGDAGKATIGAGVNYVSKRLGETATSFYLPDYTLTRAFASYEPVDNIRIGVDVTNLFNVIWYASSYSQYWVAPGAPRTITGRVTFSF
ncbi:TonB-dependent siderophore receptor [Novosphingobium naphthalenivorans]|uniref:TonB-dependent siderophore receptor n=1 Tax=Novosphingobium naphthalenivorans TaxID=273168 RepID=UPI000834838E|nr:TonB-dependent receptor [Novosphingobium naphthalenivorans]